MNGWIDRRMKRWVDGYELMNDFPMYISVHMNYNLWVVFTFKFLNS